MRRVYCLDPFLTGVKAASCEREASGEVTGEARGVVERRCVAGVSSCCLVSMSMPAPTFAVVNSCRESKLFFFKFGIPCFLLPLLLQGVIVCHTVCKQALRSSH